MNTDRSSQAREKALSTVEANQQLFRDDFYVWLKDNFHVFLEFSRRANVVWQNGRKHYSARTIMETIRHDSAIRQIKGEYKINDHATPDAARLYLLLVPEQEGLFQLRNNDSRVAA